MCVREREREEDREKDRRQKGEEGYMLLPESVFKPELSAIPDHTLHISLKHKPCVYVYVCACVREREEDRETDRRQKGEEGYMSLP